MGILSARRTFASVCLSLALLACGGAWSEPAAATGGYVCPVSARLARIERTPHG